MITVEYDSKCDCIISTFKGIFDAKTSKEYIHEIATKAKEHNCRRVISDLRKANIDTSIMDLYDIPKMVVNLDFDRSWKRAIVIKNEDRQKMQFYETTSINRGINIKLFTDMDTAMEWLNR